MPSDRGLFQLRNLAFLLLFAFISLAVISPGRTFASEEVPADKSAIKAEEAPTVKTEKEKPGFAAETFQTVVSSLQSVLFFEVPIWPYEKPADEKAEKWKLGDYYVTIPMVLLVLILGGFFFTFRYGFVNFVLFKHSIDVIRGRYDKKDDRGEISHFQALTSALSATVGLGNIAGVAVAIAIGGPGAIFWMWCSAFFGMSMKFSSCSFAQLYRIVKPDGTVLGGPMVYLPQGIKEHFPKLAPLGVVFGVMFAIFTVCASFGGGNLFQGNQTFSVVWGQTGIPQNQPLGLLGLGLKDSLGFLFGIGMATLVGLVIIGGIRRIGEVTSLLVPIMCVFYCFVCLIILLVNIQDVPAMFASIFRSAFTHEAGLGGILGVAITGFRRAGFSNEAGLGSAAIAHAAARTEEPVREGVVAMLGPFIDTIVVCTMTALTILITKSHIDPATGGMYAEGTDIKGIELTANAFGSLGALMPVLLACAVVVFAYSTIISWSYYGERATESLVGERGIMPYRIVYVIAVAFGPIFTLESIINFADMMLFSMAFPNILGMALLSGIMIKKKNDYIRRLRSGEIKPVK